MTGSTRTLGAVSLLYDLDNWVLWAIWLLAIPVGGYAFVHALMQRADAFTAADKLTKPAWLGITGASALVLIFFQPGLQKPTEWELRYRTPGMWDPLRKYGTDSLVWATGTLQRPRTAGINELTVHFDVPEGWAPVDVAETNGTGSTTEVRGAVARTTWRNPVTTAQRYEWLLRRPEAWG